MSNYLLRKAIANRPPAPGPTAAQAAYFSLATRLPPSASAPAVNMAAVYGPAPGTSAYSRFLPAGVPTMSAESFVLP